MELGEQITKYYDARTPHQKRLEIKNYLDAYIRQKDSVFTLIDHLKRSTSFYVSLFSYNAIEAIINQKWHVFCDQEKITIKTEIMNMIFCDSLKLNTIVVSHLCEILAKIGLHEYNKTFQDFFLIIDQLLNPEIP
ncbi:Exportin-6-A [Thelohanellus kitauei]|uniref:Exportin-6-A n=1 Tax=Thelohanellus kitauei TaxID=669202 RepID=A0A0C2MQP0_THEKT|nr:Exportin-6-A [Thelohanellus kitauei]